MCLSPLLKYVTNGTTGRMSRRIPCGKCPECTQKKINDWTIRIDKELERSYFPYFVTLTYNNENLPINPSYEDIDTKTGEILTIDASSSLRKKDVQDFFKRLRKSHTKKFPDSPPLKYMAVGEYGTKFGRPHYHIILLNCMDKSLIDQAWSKAKRVGHNTFFYSPIGFVHYPSLTAGAVKYVLKYLSKEPKGKHFMLIGRGSFPSPLSRSEKTILHQKLSYGTTTKLKIVIYRYLLALKRLFRGS